jgi:hypothetical protein
MSNSEKTMKFESPLDNTLIFSQEFDNMWLYPESTAPKPIYNESYNYGTECRKLSWFKKSLESSLQNHSFINNLLRDEYKQS